MRCKPGPCKLPVTLDCNFGDPQFLGDFAFQQSAEESQLRHPRGPRIRSFEFLERFVDDQQIVIGARRSRVDHVQRNSGLAPAPLLRAVRTGVIDQNAAQRIGGDREKMRAIAPLGRSGGMKPQIKLVDEGRWLQSVIGSFRVQHARGNPMQFGIESLDYKSYRRAVLLIPAAQILSHGRGVRVPRWYR